jgi:hypothetical protein
VAKDEDDEGGHGAEPEGYSPHPLVVEIENQEHGDDCQRQHLADGEHELPAVAHYLALAFGHRIHDVGVAGRDIAAERHAKEETQHRKGRDAGHEGLRQRQHDEHDHRRQEHEPAADPVGQPSAKQRPNHCPALRSRGRQAEQKRIGMILVADENEDERDAVQVPRLDQDRSHHEPPGAIALRAVVCDQMTNGGVHRGFLRH